MTKALAVVPGPAPAADHSDARSFARKVVRTGSNARAVNLARAYLTVEPLAVDLSLERAATRQRLRGLLALVEHAIAALDAQEIKP